MKEKLKEELINYVVDVLNYLDGHGIILTDEELVKDTLKREFGDFKILQEIRNRKRNQNETNI